MLYPILLITSLGLLHGCLEEARELRSKAFKSNNSQNQSGGGSSESIGVDGQSIRTQIPVKGVRWLGSVQSFPYPLASVEVVTSVGKSEDEQASASYLMTFEDYFELSAGIDTQLTLSPVARLDSSPFNLSQAGISQNAFLALVLPEKENSEAENYPDQTIPPSSYNSSPFALASEQISTTASPDPILSCSGESDSSNAILCCQVKHNKPRQECVALLSAHCEVDPKLPFCLADSFSKCEDKQDPGDFQTCCESAKDFLGRPMYSKELCQQKLNYMCLVNSRNRPKYCPEIEPANPDYLLFTHYLYGDTYSPGAPLGVGYFYDSLNFTSSSSNPSRIAKCKALNYMPDVKYMLDKPGVTYALREESKDVLRNSLENYRKKFHIGFTTAGHGYRSGALPGTFEMTLISCDPVPLLSERDKCKARAEAEARSCVADCRQGVGDKNSCIDNCKRNYHNSCKEHLSKAELCENKAYEDYEACLASNKGIRFCANILDLEKQDCHRPANTDCCLCLWENTPKSSLCGNYSDPTTCSLSGNDCAWDFDHQYCRSAFEQNCDQFIAGSQSSCNYDRSYKIGVKSFADLDDSSIKSQLPQQCTTLKMARYGHGLDHPENRQCMFKTIRGCIEKSPGLEDLQISYGGCRIFSSDENLAQTLSGISAILPLGAKMELTGSQSNEIWDPLSNQIVCNVEVKYLITPRSVKPTFPECSEVEGQSFCLPLGKKIQCQLDDGKLKRGPAAS